MNIFTKCLFLLLLSSYFVNPQLSYSQLKLELNFGEEDNYIFYKDANSDWKQETLNKEYIQNGNFEISHFLNTSPAGGDYLLLDGVSHFFKLPSNADINLNGHMSYTVSLWIYIYSSQLNGEIINADNGFTSGYRFYFDGNIPKLEIREGHSEVFSSDTALRANQWTHIGFFCDGAGDSVTFFMNGKTLKTQSFTKVTQVNTGANSYIGALVKSDPPNFLKANLDRVRFFAGQDTIFESVQKIVAKNEKTRTKKNRIQVPQNFTLFQNYPNPFNPTTKIKFELKEAGDVELSVYDLLGNNVRTLYQGNKDIGEYEYTWDGMDSKSNIVPSGIYFARLSLNGIVQTKKMVLVK